VTISKWARRDSLALAHAHAKVDHALQTMRGLPVHRSAGQEQPVKSSCAAVMEAPAVTFSGMAVESLLVV